MFQIAKICNNLDIKLPDSEQLKHEHNDGMLKQLFIAICSKVKNLHPYISIQQTVIEALHINIHELSSQQIMKFNQISELIYTVWNILLVITLVLLNDTVFVGLCSKEVYDVETSRCIPGWVHVG